MKSTASRRGFNLIEITLALLIVGTGLITILGVFPIAANTTRDAIGLSYSADAADQLLGYMAAKCKDDWVTVSNIPSSLDDISFTDTPISTSMYTLILDTGDSNSGIYTRKLDSSVYRIVTETTVTSGSATAFDAIGRVWRSPTKGYYYNGTTFVTGAEDTTYARSAQLNIELSWPATIPYNGRRKAYYSLEVSRNE